MFTSLKPWSLRHPASWSLLGWLALAAPLASHAVIPVPSSPRSTAAEARVTPRLEKELAAKQLTLGASVFIRITKQPAVLELWMQRGSTYSLFRTYPICTYSGGFGPKLKEGDHQAPEGCYKVAPAQMNPSSRFHLSFNLGYPNAYDRAHNRTGSALMVHGNCVSVGCYAMGDEAIEEIWTLCRRALAAGQPAFPVHCFPFPLTAEALESHRTHRWIGFWKELEPIYRAFETTRIPPRVVIENKSYRLAPAR